MKRLVMAACIFAWIAALPSADEKKASVLFQAAEATATVQGDLKAAIKLYNDVVKEAGANRALAAKALVRMAECYQKVGDAEAMKIYERVVRDYADQTDVAVVAQARLASAHSATASAFARRIWTPGGSDSDMLTGATISPNGRLVSYTDWATGNLAVHDFVSGRDRRVTNNTTYTTSPQHAEWAEESAVSRDGRQVAYSWFNGDDRYELRVASLEDAGVPQPRVVFDNQDVTFVFPHDWSPDNAWIAVELTRRDRTQQLGLISVRDGSLRVLKSSDWSGSTEVFFSPDGKYLAFDARAGEATDSPRDVFVLAVDGGRQTPAATGASNDTAMGWSPDGRYLLFASDRGGTIGLWSIAVADGKPAGAAELRKPDISRFSLGVSASGSLFTGVAVGDRDVRVASVDFGTGRLVSGPTRPAQTFVATNTEPAWSPDGKFLAYTSNRPPPVYNSFIVIQSIETGQVRELKPKLTYVNTLRWASDSRSFVVRGKDLKGRQGQYRVDGQTGEVSPITVIGQVSTDGRNAYFRKEVGTEGFSIVERDLTSGNEREIVRRKNLRGIFLSPDGRMLATAYADGSARWSTLLLVPLAGGEPRDLIRVREPEWLGPAPIVEWMPDGRAVLVNKFLNDNRTENELWLVPIDGGQPRKIDIGTRQFEGAVKVHPDGRQIAYVAGQRKYEVWVLENFLPSPTARK